jgi:CBS domain containing-hemolysin-like protein
MNFTMSFLKIHIKLLKKKILLKKKCIIICKLMKPLVVFIILFFITIVVAIETAFPNVSLGRLYQDYSKNKNLRLVLKIKKNMSSIAGGLLIYDNIFATLLVTLSTDFISENFGVYTRPYLTILIPLLVTLWEAIIKAYVIYDASRVSIQLAPYVEKFLLFVKPISFIIDKIAIFFIKFFIKSPKETSEDLSSLKEVKSALEFHHSLFPSDESAMVKNLLSMNIKSIEHIMIHRRDFSQMCLKKIKDILVFIGESPHEKIIIWEGSHDNVIGTISKYDILEVFFRKKGAAEKDYLSLLREKVQPAKFIPESITITTLLHTFRLRGAGLYIIVNEYGVVKGLVTPQDVLTGIVGEVDNNIERSHITKTGNGIMVHGHTPISELNRLMFWNISEKYTNVADMILSSFKQIPEIGSEGHMEGLFFKVIKNDGTRIKYIYLEKK